MNFHVKYALERFTHMLKRLGFSPQRLDQFSRKTPDGRGRIVALLAICTFITSGFEVALGMIAQRT
jgi:hypothetical protein